MTERLNRERLVFISHDCLSRPTCNCSHLNLRRRYDYELENCILTVRLKDAIQQPFESFDKLYLRQFWRFWELEVDFNVKFSICGFLLELMSCPCPVIGRRRGSNRERWISDRTWNLIDDRKEAKKKKDQAYTRAKAQAEAVNYRKLDKEVKKSCKQDKKDWIES